MKLKLERRIMSSLSTIGDLFIDGDFFCHTLEDTDRKLEVNGCSAKIYGKTAIPRGVYIVTIDFSGHYGKDMPHIMNVLCFVGVRIHIGNKPEDTEGCVLLGMYVGTDFISHSADAFNIFFGKLKAAIANGETVTLEIL